MRKEFSVSQKQAIIKLIEKRVRISPIPLLNDDYKIASKALSKRLKNILHSLVISE